MSKALATKNVELAGQIGGILAAARRKRGVTREKLAEDAGCSYDGIAKLEQGNRVPNLQTVAKVAGALGVDLFQLFSVEFWRSVR